MSKPTHKQSLDRSTIGGVVVACAGVLAGLFLDGGSLRQLIQPSAALIVLGGTLGAVMIQFPHRLLLQAWSQLREVAFDVQPLSHEVIEVLVGYAQQARKQGLLSLDVQLAAIEDPFLRKCLTCAVDGLAIREVRKMMEVELYRYEEREEAFAHVFDAAGGFAPTFGIIGAVLGLIQVMQRLDNMSEVGKGIAVAFVATLYGVGSANLILLPLAGKLKIRARERHIVREMTLEAVTLIIEGSSPRALRQRLESYLEANPAEAEAPLVAEMVTR